MFENSVAFSRVGEGVHIVVGWKRVWALGLGVAALLGVFQATSYASAGFHVPFRNIVGLLSFVPAIAVAAFNATHVRVGAGSIEVFQKPVPLGGSKISTAGARGFEVVPSSVSARLFDLVLRTQAGDQVLLRGWTSAATLEAVRELLDRPPSHLRENDCLPDERGR